MSVFGGLLMNNLVLMKNCTGVGGGGMKGTLNLPLGNTIHVNLRKNDCCVVLPHDAIVCNYGIS